MKFPTLLAGTAVLVLVACGETESADEASEKAALANQGAVAADVSAVAALEPRTFAEQAAASDLFELESARLAEEMASERAVEDFASMMIEDHTASTENLREAAAKASPPITIEPQLNPSQRSQLDRLREAGDGSDAIYIQQQVAAHERALGLMQVQAEGEGPFAEFAAQTASVIERHLERARQLGDEVPRG